MFEFCHRSQREVALTWTGPPFPAPRSQCRPSHLQEDPPAPWGTKDSAVSACSHLFTLAHTCSHMTIYDSGVISPSPKPIHPRSLLFHTWPDSLRIILQPPPQPTQPTRDYCPHGLHRPSKASAAPSSAPTGPCSTTSLSPSASGRPPRGRCHHWQKK